MSISAWPSIEPTSPPVRLLARLLDQAALQDQPEDDREHHDHQRTADELAEHELPAEQEPDHDRQLGDEVRGGDLERHRGGEVGAAPEERARERDRGIGARRGRRAEHCCLRERARPVVRQQPLHLLLRDDCLDDAGEGKAEDQRPQDRPEHPERERERVDELGTDVDRDDHLVRAKRRTAASSSLVLASASC
jgi:hypothetical protein